MIIDNCLDALLQNDGRDVFVFNPDHKIRSFFSDELCLEGALDGNEITIEDCNNGHKDE
jgi:hypothetical protein